MSAELDDDRDGDEPNDADAWASAVKESVAVTAAYRFAQSFVGRTRARSLGNAVLIDMEYSAHELRRTATHIDRDEPPRWITSLSLTSRCEMSQDGRSVVLGPGDISFYDSSRPLEAKLEGGRELLLSLPRSDLLLPDGLLQQMTATRYPSDAGFGFALAATLSVLSEVTEPALRGRSTELSLIHI